MRPTGFDQKLRTPWTDWVLDNGLPELPDLVGDGQTVPIAFWSGPDFGAVLHVTTCAHDQFCGPEEHFATDVQCFRRMDEGWEFAGVSGGTDWPTDNLAGLAVADDCVHFDEDDMHMVRSLSGNWACFAVNGFVGKAARWIELIQNGESTRRCVDAPTGAVVVAMSEYRPATIRVLAANGTEVGHHTFN
jgi:hypothetical protein